MSEKVDVSQLVADGDAMRNNNEVCPKCGALIVMTPDGPVCNCPSAGEAAEPVSAAESGAPGEEQVDMLSLLAQIPGAPSQQQINAWKQQFGKVYVFPVDMKEMYIWRPLRRREWQAIQAAGSDGLANDEAKFQEHVVLKAILWPQLDPVQLSLVRAGLIPTLFGVIMHGSYFFSPDFALSLVREL